MGKLNHEPSIQHFSHPHPLVLCSPQSSTITLCSGCHLQSSGWMYICNPCNFSLHVSCAQMPQLITHPAHSTHPLSLLPTPAYSVGLFHCDGCGRRGHGFSYHCNSCEFDIHITCASNPLSLSHHSHPHELKLTFEPPYHTAKGFSCDICHQIGSNHWLYRCATCEFDAHMECATGMPRTSAQPQTQPHLLHQYYNSFPEGGIQNHYRPAAMNYSMHSQSMGASQPAGFQPTATTGTGNAVMNTMVHGLVDGAAKQVGQNFVQSIESDGNNGNGSDAGGSGGSSASPSLIRIGASLLSGMFSDSDAQN